MLFSLLALCSTTVLAGANIENVGTLQLLHYNNLFPENNGTSAILVHESRNYENAKEVCSELGETLYDYESTSKQEKQEIGYQFDYLKYKGYLSNGKRIWIGGNANTTRGFSCYAYDYGKKQKVSADCSLGYPVLCKSSAPATISENSNKHNASTEITVQAKDLSITGYRDARSFRFLGIPYADPPINRLRFEPPKEYTGNKVINATEWKLPCIQAGVEGTEDCLYLNVYTPTVPSGNISGRPVAFWIFGGEFIEGGAGYDDYDGGNFASRGDVVLVTLNYRLGLLGGLATKNLLKGSNFIRDQIAALKWVQKYIRSFGGDPDNVTIFGQSAGGQSVTALLSSSAAKGTFHKAILQSNPLDLPSYSREIYDKQITPNVARALGCLNTEEKELVDCLKKVDSTKFAYNSTLDYAFEILLALGTSAFYVHDGLLLNSIEPYLPVVSTDNDGVIDYQFFKLLESDSLPNKVPFIATEVKDEAYGYVGASNSDNQLLLDTELEVTYTPKKGKAIAQSGYFKASKDNATRAGTGIGLIYTLSEWFCPTDYLLRNSSLSFPSLYQILFNKGHIPTNASSPIIQECFPNIKNAYNATCHASDYLLVFGNLNTKTLGVYPYESDEEVYYSQTINDIWSSFFHTGNPNPDTNYLRTRGPAYRATLKKFQDFKLQGYYDTENKVNILDYNKLGHEKPLFSDECSFFDNYGYTFQKFNPNGIKI